MSNDLPAPYVGTAVRRLDRNTAYAVGLVRAKTALTMAEISAITACGHQVMDGILGLKVHEEQLIKLSPLGEAHYQSAADATAAALIARLRRLESQL